MSSEKLYSDAVRSAGSSDEDVASPIIRGVGTGGPRAPPQIFSKDD